MECFDDNKIATVEVTVVINTFDPRDYGVLKDDMIRLRGVAIKTVMCSKESSMSVKGEVR